MASMMEGWSEPRLTKQWVTPSSHKASKKASLAVYLDVYLLASWNLVKAFSCSVAVRATRRRWRSIHFNAAFSRSTARSRRPERGGKQCACRDRRRSKIGEEAIDCDVSNGTHFVSWVTCHVLRLPSPLPTGFGSRSHNGYHLAYAISIRLPSFFAVSPQFGWPSHTNFQRKASTTRNLSIFAAIPQSSESSNREVFAMFFLLGSIPNERVDVVMRILNLRSSSLSTVERGYV